MDKQQDFPPFGLLTKIETDLWQKDFDFNLFGENCTIPLYVDIDEDDGLEKDQINAFNHFIKLNDFSGICEKAIIEYCNTIIANPMYEIDKSKVIADSVNVSAQSLTFPYATNTPTFGLLCNCSWDLDNGLGIKFVDGKFHEVGTQNILL